MIWKSKTIPQKALRPNQCMGELGMRDVVTSSPQACGLSRAHAHFLYVHCSLVCLCAKVFPPGCWSSSEWGHRGPWGNTAEPSSGLEGHFLHHVS
jgi:hypothetical protein